MGQPTITPQQRSRSSSNTGLPHTTTTTTTTSTSTSSRTNRCLVRPVVDHGRKRSRSLDDHDDGAVEKISTTTTTLPATATATDQPDHPDDDYDMTWENDKYHSTTVLLLKVKRDDVQICIKGRGYLTNCSPYRRPDDNHHHNDSENDDPFSISIHGYHIPSVVLQSDADDNDDKKKKSTVYFDSARWSSWLTLSLRCGHVLQIASSSSSVVTTTTDPPSRTFDIYKVNHPSMTTTTTTIRPTLIPTSWCRAVHDIVVRTVGAGGLLANV